MIFRRKTYKIRPEKLEEFNHFFHNYLYPNQQKHGAKLVGRWTNENHTEIMALWQYESIEEYEEIESKIRESDLHRKAQEVRNSLGQLYLESSQDFLTPTTFIPPKHVVAVSGYITNEAGEVLLVRNLHRSDTMEMPGGQVEEGETLEEAIHREIFEETGIKVSIKGVTGIYQNMNKVICVVFRGEYVSGETRPAEGETSEVIFASLTRDNIKQYITKQHFRTRTLDAMEPNYIPFEIYQSSPYELLSRFDVKKED